MATKRFLLLDDGGASADRYTLYDTQPVDGRILYIGFSEKPYHPQGVGQHGETTVREFKELTQELRRKGVSNIGRPVKLDELPAQAQKFAKSFMDDQLSSHSGMRAGPGKPGMKFERDDVEITTTLHPLQLDGVSKSSKLHSLDKFTEQYIATALWSTNDESNDSGGMPFDENYGPSDLTNEALDKMIKDCRDFQKENAIWLSEAGNDSQNGHDFWLTRNGHGAGFWDRDYAEDVSEGLSKAAKEYGTVNLYLSGGKIHHD